MTDRELLELAAKAICIDIGYGFDRKIPYILGLGKAPSPTYWNPLDNSDDVLGLEISLRLTSAWEPMRGGWNIGGIVDGEFTWLAFHEDRKRATTMAAAKIGKAINE